MNRKLKKLLDLLTNQANTEQKEIFDHNGYMYVLYTFVLRYQAIRSEFNLPELKSDIKKYIKNEDNHLYPYDDIVHPFFLLIDDLNSGKTEDVDYRSYFGISTDVELVEAENVFNFLNLTEKAGIRDWSLANFSEYEFDVFFKKLIQSFSQKNDEWIRTYPQKLSEFVDFILPENTSVFYLGDEKADLAVQRINKDNESFLSGYSSNIFWYYLRPILFGEKKLHLRIHEISSLTEVSTQVVVGHIPYGKVGKDFPKEIRSVSKTLEGYYLTMLTKKLQNNDGLGVFFLPQSFLYKNSNELKNLRKYLVESGGLKTIVRLPEGLFIPMTSASFVMLILDYSKKHNSVQYIDGFNITERIDSRDKKQMTNLFTNLKSFYYSNTLFFSIAKNISNKKIKSNDYSLAVTNYVNVLDEGDRHFRYGDEELWSFYEVFEPYKLQHAEVDDKAKIIGGAELSDSFEKFKIDIKKHQKISNQNSAYILKNSAFLLALQDSTFKVGYFEFEGEPIYLQKNVRAFGLKSSESIEYLALELLSGFVSKQLRKNEVNRIIPLSKNSTLKNVFLRIPPITQQKQLYNDEIQKLANERLKEIEGLHESIRYVEKEVFSSFAHDFGKLLLKVTSNIDVLSNYLEGLNERKIINLKDSVFFEKVTSPGQSIKEVLSRLKSNQAIAQEFLQDEVQFYTGEAVKELEEVNLNKLIADWVKRQETSNFTILTGDIFSPPEETDKHFGLSYTAKGNKSDILSVLNNFLSNAVEHGFNDKKKQYEFIIYLQQSFYDDGRIHQSIMHIGNNGKPFPKDFSCKDFFTFRHKGPNSNGSGKGGYSIKRRLDNMGATINCESSALPKDKYPVQFEIHFNFVTL